MPAKPLELLNFMYKEVVEKIDLGIHVIDVNEKTIIYNQRMMEIEGMNIEDVLDKNILEVFRFEHAEESTLWQVLRTGQSIQNVKQTYFNNKGEEITTINHTFPIKESGSIIGAVEIAKDITKLEKMIQENILIKGDTRYTFEHIISNSPQIAELIETSKRATRTGSSVLIVGETGTGKELFSQSIHNGSPRSNQPFISQNCAALPDTLMEDLLFGSAGNEKNDQMDRPGLFEQANGGTLLLDEIESLSLSLQAKLLHVIQEKKVKRTGSSELIPVDVRLIATSCEDPIDAIAAGKLRKDLYYRLSVVSIFLPPLRERKEDIDTLTNYFIDKYNHLFGMSVRFVDEEVRTYFNEYNWPGNVRQLENVIEGAMNLMDHEDTMTFNHLPIQFRNQSRSSLQTIDQEKIEGFLYQHNKTILPLDDYIQEAETYYIRKALLHHDFNVTKTAKALGMSRQNLQYRIRKYDIEKEQ
ncbi:arginine utilization regulatory protein [Bacillus ectoiniformans]|uniref:sigma-54 interaction domain-containing protein n=1 Tax=Bacillus ectoiniformans TaxID=1494429 RepID=UPI0019591066|nr:sigma 54-interacting transcriptional regulator [Bacillus ectoiniformans]MBM7648482.1 arginine utilization regulatory protein [Bacillus ectoiniformans]